MILISQMNFIDTQFTKLHKFLKKLKNYRNMYLSKSVFR